MIRNLLKQRSLQYPHINNRRPPIQQRNDWLDNYWQHNPEQLRFFGKTAPPPSPQFADEDASDQSMTVPRDMEVGLALRCSHGQSRNVLLQTGVHTPSPHPSIRSLSADSSSCTRSTALEALAVRGALVVSTSGKGGAGQGRATLLSDWFLAEESRGLLRGLSLVWSGRDLKPESGSSVGGPRCAGRLARDRGEGDLLMERLLGSTADWQAEICVLLRIWGGPWDFEDCSMSCGGGSSSGCVLFCSREAKSALVRCELQGLQTGEHRDISTKEGDDGPGGGGRGKLGYGVVCTGRSLSELRNCSIQGASDAALLTSGRAAALLSRCRLLDNSLGVWVLEHGYIRVRHW